MTLLLRVRGRAARARPEPDVAILYSRSGRSWPNRIGPPRPSARGGPERVGLPSRPPVRYLRPRPHYPRPCAGAPMKPPSLTIGIEEEYQIIDPQTRELKSYIT